MKIISTSEEQTLNIAKQFAKKLKRGDIVTLSGNLGAGKTVFAKGIASELNVTEPVLSPTFTLVNAYYSGKYPFYHFDAYRLNNSDEAIMAGIDEYFILADGICVVEWHENILDLLSKYKKINVTINYVSQTEREIIINEQ